MNKFKNKLFDLIVQIAELPIRYEIYLVLTVAALTWGIMQWQNS